MEQKTHSKNFEKVKKWKENGRPNSWMRNAVKAGAITKEEYKEITGEDYE